VNVELFPYRVVGPGALRVLWATVTDDAGAPIRDAEVTVDGDVRGPLAFVPATGRYEGVFEFPLLNGRSVTVRVHGGFEQEVPLTYVLDQERPPTWAETGELLDHYTARFAPLVRQQIVFHSEELHRDIRAAVVTDHTVPEEQKQILSFTGRVHGTEETGTLACFRLLDYLLAGPEGRELLRHYVFLIMPYTNIFGGRRLPECGGWGQVALTAGNLNRAFIPGHLETPEAAAMSAFWDQYWPDGGTDNHTASSVPQQQIKPWTFVHPAQEEPFDTAPMHAVALAMNRHSSAMGYPCENDVNMFRMWGAVARYIDEGGIVPLEEGVMSTQFWGQVQDSGSNTGAHDDPRSVCEYLYHRYHAFAATCEANNRFAGEESVLCHTYDVAQPTFHRILALCREGLRVHKGYAHGGLPITRVCQHGDIYLHVDGATPGARRRTRKALWAQRRAIRLSGTTGGWTIDFTGVAAEPGLTALAAWEGAPPRSVKVDGVHVVPIIHDGWVFVSVPVRGIVKVSVVQ